MFKLIRSYIFWSYERGSFHYDIMVTAILLFMFVSPHFINYNDRPVETAALHSSEVLVREAGSSGTSSRFVYQIRADDMGSAKTKGDGKSFMAAASTGATTICASPVAIFHRVLARCS